MCRGSRLSAVGASGDDLAQGFLARIARGKQSGGLGAHLAVGEEIAVLVQLGEIGKNIVVGDQPDRLEHAVDLEVGLFSAVDIFDRERRDKAVALDLNGDMARHEVDVVDGFELIHIALGRGGIVAAEDQIDLFTEVGEIDRVAQRRVAGADNGCFLFAEEAAVAYRAPADTASAEFVLTRDAQLSAAHTVGDDDGFGLIAVAVGRDSENIILLGQALHLRGKALHTQCVDLRLDIGGKLKAVDLFIGGVVFDFGGKRCLSAEACLFNDQRGQTRTRGVDRGGHPCDAASDDDKIVHMQHSFSRNYYLYLFINY